MFILARKSLLIPNFVVVKTLITKVLSNKETNCDYCIPRECRELQNFKWIVESGIVEKVL